MSEGIAKPPSKAWLVNKLRELADRISRAEESDVDYRMNQEPRYMQSGASLTLVGDQFEIAVSILDLWPKTIDAECVETAGEDRISIEHDLGTKEEDKSP